MAARVIIIHHSPNWKTVQQRIFRHGFHTKTFASNLFDGGGDQPLSAWQGTANVDGSNFARLGYSGTIVPDRILAAASWRFEYFQTPGYYAVGGVAKARSRDGSLHYIQSISTAMEPILI